MYCADKVPIKLSCIEIFFANSFRRFFSRNETNRELRHKVPAVADPGDSSASKFRLASHRKAVQTLRENELSTAAVAGPPDAGLQRLQCGDGCTPHRPPCASSQALLPPYPRTPARELQLLSCLIATPACQMHARPPSLCSPRAAASAPIEGSTLSLPRWLPLSLSRFNCAACHLIAGSHVALSHAPRVHPARIIHRAHMHALSATLPPPASI